MNIQDWFPLDWLVWSPCSPATLKSLLQHHSWKASVLRCSAFFIVQLSHLYMTSGKTIALTIWTFVGKMMSLPFNTLSRFVIAFLPRIKHLLISQLQSMPSVILEPKKIKSITASTFSLLFAMKWWDQRYDLHFFNVVFQASFFILLFHPIKKLFSFSSVQFSHSVVSSSATPWTAAC